MKSFPAADAKRRFGELLRTADYMPVEQAARVGRGRRPKPTVESRGGLPTAGLASLYPPLLLAATGSGSIGFGP